MQKTTLMPPAIIQHFNAALLSMPAPKLRDWSGTLWRIYQKIKKKLEKRTLKNPARNKRFQEYEQEFLKLYEQITAKEKELEEKTDHITQVFGYNFPSLGRDEQKVFGRISFGYKTQTLASKRRKHLRIQKIF